MQKEQPGHAELGQVEVEEVHPFSWLLSNNR